MSRGYVHTPPGLARYLVACADEALQMGRVKRLPVQARLRGIGRGMKLYRQFQYIQEVSSKLLF